jgi:carboxyl-terminal processing protease
MECKGRKSFFGLVLVLIVFHSNANANAKDEPQQAGRDEVLAQAVAIAQQNALNASKVDWKKTQMAAMDILEKDSSDAGLTAAIRSVLKALGDRHSSYRPPSQTGNSDSASARSVTPDTKKVGPIAVSSKQPNGVPVIAVNSWSGLSREAASEAAAEARSALNASLGKRTCGLVLDLSSNSGGNMWPMVTGVLPLLSDGHLGQFEDRTGKLTAIELVDHQLLYGGVPHFLNAPVLPAPKYLPRFIAAIIGPATASSGEITAILFKGQDNVRFFGRPTAGLVTANRVFPLGNGGILALTISTVSDREGKIYLGPVVPDIISDAPLNAADDWLKDQCS